MKPNEKIEIIRNPYTQPDNIKKFFLIMLCSFAVGLVPILSGMTFLTAEYVAPKEEALQ